MATDRYRFGGRRRDDWMDWWLRLVFVATIVVILAAGAVTAFLAGGAGGVAFAGVVLAEMAILIIAGVVSVRGGVRP